jgi:hypothetical protein
VNLVLLLYVTIGGAFEINVIAGIIILVYIILSLFFDYLLFISKDVSYDNDSLVIEAHDNVEKISLEQISMIRRKFYFFYQISFHAGVPDRSVIIFISPNPPLSAPKKFKEFKKKLKLES